MGLNLVEDGIHATSVAGIFFSHLFKLLLVFFFQAFLPFKFSPDSFLLFACDV